MFMKNWIIVAAFASAILAGCTKNEVRVDMPDQAISFTAAVGANITKAMIDDTAYPNDETFGTYAYYLPAGQNWAANAGDAKLYIPKSVVTYTAAPSTSGYNWTTETPYYWPSAGSLTFFSFSPWSITSVECNTTNGIKITDWDVDAYQKVDVMVADVAKDKTANETRPGVVEYNGVPTVFRHKLSQIVAFKFNTDKDYTNGRGDVTPWEAGDKQIVVTGISINSIATKGTFTSGPNPSATELGDWTGHDVDKNYTWYSVVTGGTTIIHDDTPSSYPTAVTPNQAPATNGYLLVLPQTFGETETITLNYTIKTYNGTDWVNDEVTKIIKLKDIHAASGAFEMNKKITYNFTIGLNQIYWAPSVVNWDEESRDVTVPVA